MKLLFSFYDQVRRFSRRTLDFVYARVYRGMPGLVLRGKVCFWGKPIIDIRNGGRIEIGEGTRLISTNFGTHVNYGVPVKLVADKPGAQIVIGRNCTLAGTCIHAYGSIRIGDHCLLGVNTNILDALGHPTALKPGQRRTEHVEETRPITIEDDVWVALNCMVLPGTHIGARAVVSSNSVVSGIIPPDSFVAGSPARVLPGYYAREHDSIGSVPGPTSGDGSPGNDMAATPMPRKADGPGEASLASEMIRRKIAEALKVDPATIDNATTAQDIVEWDSMGTMALLVMLNAEFGIDLQPNEIHKLQSVEGILSVLRGGGFKS